MTEDEQYRCYFAKRAAVARRLAKDAVDPAIRRVHEDMAHEYERRAAGDQTISLSDPTIGDLRDFLAQAADIHSSHIAGSLSN